MPKNITVEQMTTINSNSDGGGGLPYRSRETPSAGEVDFFAQTKIYQNSVVYLRNYKVRNRVVYNSISFEPLISSGYRLFEVVYGFKVCRPYVFHTFSKITILVMTKSGLSILYLNFNVLVLLQVSYIIF